MPKRPFRHSAAFGKRIEYLVLARMLKEGMDVYRPLIDDHAVDAIVMRDKGSVALIQIKARSADATERGAGLFAAIPHPKVREDYWFVFYSERMDTTWVMTSREFIQDSVQNRTGENIGLRAIWFNGMRRNKATGKAELYTRPRFEKYVATDFGRIQRGAR